MTRGFIEVSYLAALPSDSKIENLYPEKCTIALSAILTIRPSSIFILVQQYEYLYH